jgi:branched-chain amino acid transport system ATP-binding protein
VGAAAPGDAAHPDAPAGGRGRIGVLELRGLSKSFGGVQAVLDLTLTLSVGRITGLIGPNGAGKTTLFNVITGLLRPTQGAVRFHGEDITGLPSYAASRRGISRTFQLVRVFPSLTVLENVLVGACFGHDAKGHTLEESRPAALEQLRFVGLEGEAHRPAGSLPIASRKRLEVARAMATRPSLLLLDEVIAGLTPTESGQLMELIEQIRARGTTIILIEHVMKAIMNLSDRIVVLHHGEKLAEGPPRDIARDPAVVNAYLGEQEMS